MISKIVAFSIRNKLIISLLVLALIGFGLFSIKKLHLGALPDITNNQIQVITNSPSLSTLDVEQFITHPVELALSNLQNIEEIRSISRFGLSVVTVVFDEKLGTYLPRQLIEEKLSEVQEEIPKELGKPFMGPISTGLGQIYEYTLETDETAKDKYSLTELRTIQDWLIKRQLSMVPGVVEINSFGGNIKQYEIALDPDRMYNYGVGIQEIYEAIENNNSNSGGAYIEQNHKAYFIRGEGLAASIEDLKNIVIKTEAGLPLLVKDVAEVKIGSAIRYGALTKDGKGEAVGGTVMMLKGASPDATIKNVKERMEQIQKSLPEGISIQPFLDRSELIHRTISTVSKNLIEGALIVIFVLTILLGHLRGGLIVASIIPLSLLFAFIMMNIFKVPANLMSLGAIDFGILVDGAVIIVEAVIHLIERSGVSQSLTRITSKEMDQLALKSGTKMMHSAFFGQLIILIVFFPILALTDVEGKMFRPMALTFSFAVLGATILCLTYVPMVSALFLKPSIKKKKRNPVGNLSRFIMQGIKKVYHPFLDWALRKKAWILIISIGMLGISIWTFNRMGAVFIPSLDEGDIAMHAALQPGSSLTEAVEVTNKIEKMLLDSFPEVNHVLARMGVSEIPTDPMPMDLADMFILLKPKKEWTSASSKEELSSKIKEKLSVIPGVSYQFSQPIELKFNELLTGIKEDIAIKIFGDDLDVLSQKGQELIDHIQHIQGIGDIALEATEGLPQVVVRYKKEKLAQYGLSIQELNHVLETAYAGKTAGQILEGERRFDIVLRLASMDRNNIETLRNLPIMIPGHQPIPLQEVADVVYEQGPMQISREDTRRRIYIGINVRGRDLESLVTEIQETIDKKLNLPSGYYITYGGDFENLQKAKKRLGLVVPIALLLIFILLYFALNSLKEAVLIFMAIPLAAIGGIFSLSLRGLPFSISAGVGFIVLFGVAVLNGLVLINSLNELKKEGITDLKRRIKRGTDQRLRPILLTATAAIMGFTPMALSTSAGAEVQRPLATVVIGGLITATLLSLIVIPVLYSLIENRTTVKTIQKRKRHPLLWWLILIPTFIFMSASASAQTDTVTISSLDQAEQLAMNQNLRMQVAALKVKKQHTLQKSSLDLPATSFYYGKEEFGHHLPGIQSIGIAQSIDFPTLYKNKKLLLQEETQLQITQQALVRNELSFELKSSWYQLQTAFERRDWRQRLDSFYANFLNAAELRFETGETNKLEYLAAKEEWNKIKLLISKSNTEIKQYESDLRVLLNSDIPLNFAKSNTSKISLPAMSISDSLLLEQNPMSSVLEQQIQVAQQKTAVEKSKLLPSLEGSYALQNIDHRSGFQSFQLGIGIPLWFKSGKAKVQASRMEMDIKKKEREHQRKNLQSFHQQLLAQYQETSTQLHYYENEGLSLSEERIKSSHLAFTKGEIGYVEFLQNIQLAADLREDYLNTLDQYNLIVLQIQALSGFQK